MKLDRNQSFLGQLDEEELKELNDSAVEAEERKQRESRPHLLYDRRKESMKIMK